MGHPPGVWRRVADLGRQGAAHMPIRITRAGIARWRSGDSTSCRRRACLLISLVTAGAAWFEQDGRRVVVRRGEVFLQQVGSRQAHGTEGKALHKRWLQFEGPALGIWLNTLGLAGRDVVRPVDLPGLTVCIREAFRLLRHRPIDYRRRLSVVACDILLRLDDGRRLPQELDRLLGAIAVGPHRQWASTTLAQAAGCTPRRLRALCRQHLGRTPTELVADERVARARSLLEDGTESVKEIARAIGFADQFAFSHWFSRRCGCAPSAWRERRRSPHPNGFPSKVG